MNNDTERANYSSLTATGDAAEWFGLLIAEAAEACGVRLTEARVRVYAHDLADLDARVVIDAFRACRREGSGFFPSIAEVRRAALGSPEDRGILMWATLERAAERIGAYQSLIVDDACCAAALDAIGGWPAFCAMEDGPMLTLARTTFLAAYREARRLGLAASRPIRCVGLLEAGGYYERREGLAVGHVTAGGAVLSERDRPAMTEREPKRLGSGDTDEDQQ